MNIAYFDCFAGAGGDMIVAAMLDAGVDRNELIRRLNSLPIGPMQYQIESVMRKGISATGFEPSSSSTAPAWDEHDHSHPHDHGHSRITRTNIRSIRIRPPPIPIVRCLRSVT